MNKYNGLINIYKETGFTSNDVVAKLRGILHQKKIGHTGTLDPDATGVLVVCLGTGTKLVEMLTDHDKEYIAVCKLGVITDTQDMSGTVLEEADVHVTRHELHEAVQAFVFPFDDLRAAETLPVLFHPYWGIHHLGVFPGAEPEKDDSFAPRPGLTDQRVGNGEIEAPLLRLCQLPAHREQEGVHTQIVCDLPDLFHICRGRGIGIVYLARDGIIGRAVDEKNLFSMADADFRFHCFPPYSFLIYPATIAAQIREARLWIPCLRGPVYSN